jgi:hypothetical protein
MCYKLFFGLLLFSTSLQAVMIDELTFGDIENDTFILDIGENTISGNTTMATNSSLLDQDEFFFTVSANTQVTSIVFELFNLVITGDPSRLTKNFFLEGAPTLGLETVIVFDLNGPTTTTPLDMFAAQLPLVAGSYFFNHSDGISFGGAVTTGSFDYRTTLLLEPVPVPTAVWLFGSGLIGLIGFAKRKGA